MPNRPDSLVASKDGALVVVLAAGGSAAGLGRIVAQLCGDEPTLRAGLGRPWPGASGPMRSYREALDCRDVAARIGLPDRIARADELLVYLVLWRDREVLVDLVRSTLIALGDLRGGAADYLDTLRAYFAHQGVATTTAKALHLSVRGFTYRLERIKSALPHDLDDPRQRLTVELALTAAQLLDWPRLPLAESDA